MEIENIKNQWEMKNTIKGNNSRLDELEDQMNGLEDKIAENTQWKE